MTNCERTSCRRLPCRPSRAVAVPRSVADTAPVVAQSDPHQHDHPVPERLGTVNFETTCAAATKADFNRATALLHSFAFSRRDQRVREGADRRPDVRNRRVGHRAERMGQPVCRDQGRRAAREGLRPRWRARRRLARSLSASATTLPRSPSCTRTRRPSITRRALPPTRAPWPASPRRTRRQRSADLRRARVAPDRAADRQDLREAAAGGRRPRADVRAGARSSRPRALHHPRLRRPAAGAARARRRAPLRTDRAVRAARAAHALAHVHARRLLARVGRDEPGLGGGREARGLHGARSCTRSTTRLRLPADGTGRGRWQGPRGTAGHRGASHVSQRRAAARRQSPRAATRHPPFRHVTRWSAANGSARPRCSRVEGVAPQAWPITYFARAIGAARAGNPATIAGDIAQLVEAARRADEQERRLLGGAGRDPAADGDRRGRRGRPDAKTRRCRWPQRAPTPRTRRKRRRRRRVRLRRRARCSPRCCSRPAAPADARQAYEAVLKKEPRRFRAEFGAGLAAETGRRHGRRERPLPIARGHLRESRHARP